MNDFTKEELEYLHELAGSISFAGHAIDDEALKSKIQSMIDNYCDHEWENICCQCTMDKIYCYKCEKDMGDLKERYPNE